MLPARFADVEDGGEVWTGWIWPLGWDNAKSE
jgi:hypothetical protein